MLGETKRTCESAMSVVDKREGHVGNSKGHQHALGKGIVKLDMRLVGGRVGPAEQ